MQLEIVSHCWRYARLLTYQLSSLVLYPPEHIRVRVTVCCSAVDAATGDVLSFFSRRHVPGVEWNWLVLERRNLMRRAIGRNLAARQTVADWVWFTDCDMCFGHNALDELGRLLDETPYALLYPRRIRISRDHATGDEQIRRAGPVPRVIDVEPAEFTGHRFPRAIGPVQVVRADVAREHGYCDGTKWQRPAEQWQRCFEDVSFRKQMQTATGEHWQPVVVKNVYRIRHSEAGRDVTEIML
ncbi:MAG: glycosyltransferase [Planctomycetaceae bacterium]|nr:glycosyltransferase [Planctomycetaceae bacterium]